MLEKEKFYIYKMEILTKIMGNTTEENEYRRLKFINKEEDYIVVDYTDYDTKKYTSSNFFLFFYNEIIEKYFNILQIGKKENTLVIKNKNEISKKIETASFEYFKEYPKKIKDVNFILKEIIKKLKYENFEQELESSSIYPYIFKLEKILTSKKDKIETKSYEVISGYNLPTKINYFQKKFSKDKIMINFEEKIDEKKVSCASLIEEFRNFLNISKSFPFKFDFIIRGYYIYDIVKNNILKIEIIKEVKFFQSNIISKRVLVQEDFNEKNIEKTYDEIKEEMYKYLNLMKNKEIIDKKKIMNFINKISFLERNRVFETVKSYVEKNKISFLKFDTGEIRTNEHVLLFFEENLKKYMKIDNENIKTNLKKNKEDDIQEIKKLSEKERKKNLKIMYREIFSAINSNGEIIFQIKEFKEKVKLLTKEEKEKLFKNIEFSIPKENCILKLKTNENRSYMYSRDIIKLLKEILEI